MAGTGKRERPYPDAWDAHDGHLSTPFVISLGRSDQRLLCCRHFSVSELASGERTRAPIVPVALRDQLSARSQRLTS